MARRNAPREPRVYVGMEAGERQASPRAAGGLPPLSIPLRLSRHDRPALVRLRRALHRLEERGPAAAADMLGSSGLTACEACLRRSWQVRHRDPRQMLQLAEIAAALAGCCRPDRHGSRRVADLRSYSLAELANAQRANHCLPAAQRSLATAVEQFVAGSRPPLLAARLAAAQGQLLSDLGDRTGALKALDAAIAAYRHLGRPQLVAAALINKGLIAIYAGQPREALAWLGEAGILLDAGDDLGLSWAVRHNLSLALAVAGRYREARLATWQREPLYASQGGTDGLRMLRWLRARIHAGLEERARAVVTFEEVRHETLAAGHPYAAACMTLELCDVLARDGRASGAGAARTLAADAADTVLRLEVGREAAAAMLLLKTSLRFGLGCEVMSYRRLATFLTAAEHDQDRTLASFLREA
jgi:tetratricopeptide (TPR) repeat protein